MPTSNWQNISYSIGLIRELQPASILDVGVGFGLWGILCRKFLDASNGRYFPDQWKVRIDGIEVYRKYIHAYHSFFYTQLYYGDARVLLDTIRTSYDLVILGDVLEHFEKAESHRFLDKCLGKAKRVLIHIPIGPNWPQGAVYGNCYERHLSFWSMADFRNRTILRKRLFQEETDRAYAVLLLQGH